DHHIVVDSFGDINIEDPTASSCAQIITLMIADTADAYQLSPLGARALYMGIVGDTNRFMYSSTDARTFRAAAFLMDCGINLKEISQAMYLTNKKDLDVKAYILNHYQVRGDIAYYLLRQSELEALGISRTEGSNYIHELADIEEFKIWMAVTENTDGTYRISLRSRDYNVRKAAVAFNGGGHVLASGASMSSLAQLDELLDYLQRIIDERIMA
ncbi:MAG: DHH family phosphoesterase, partial [bacterium]